MKRIIPVLIFIILVILLAYGSLWAKERPSKSGETIIGIQAEIPNAWGVYDMHGNISEWVQDWYGNYPTYSVTDPEGPSSGLVRVVRGCSWVSVSRYCRSANRYGDFPDFRDRSLGFRLLRTR